MERKLRRGEGGGTPALPLFVVGLILLLGGLVGILPAGPAEAAPAGRACLACHADAGLAAVTAKGEPMSLAVSGKELRSSVHRDLACRDCHPGVRLDAHPGPLPASSLAAYRAETSKACLGCHPAEQLGRKANHAAIVFEDQELSCAGCHGAHGVRPVAAWKAALGENEYCLLCHANALTLMLPGGGTVSLDVDREQLAASVHPDHRCFDCHAGFSRDAHPAGTLGDRSRRELAAAKTCGRCHADKLRQVEGSVHFALLRSGAGKAPGCTDCHSAHGVAAKERYATLAGTPCRSCHREIFDAYAGSMHGVARFQGGHLEAPFCSECHRAHDVSGTASPEKIRAACLGCHPHAPDLHASWLPNAGLHLDAVSCAACHAPLAKRMVSLRVVEEGSGRAVTRREVAGLLGGDAALALDPAGDGIDGAELWSFLRRLEGERKQGLPGVSLAGRLEVTRGVDAHRLAGKAEAVRRCETCHQAGSAFFSQVAVKLAGDDGRPVRHAGAPGVLVSAASVLPMGGFYALGSTRIGVLDWLLLLAVLAGLAVPALHITARLLAARSRKGEARP